MDEDVENPLLLSCRGTSELAVGKRQDVDPSSIIAHNSQACPAWVNAHTGLTQELEGLKIIDDTGVKGSAEGYLSDGVPETTKTCSVECENILCDNVDGSTEVKLGTPSTSPTLEPRDTLIEEWSDEAESQNLSCRDGAAARKSQHKFGQTSAYTGLGGF